jgi:hypothetical protein
LLTAPYTRASRHVHNATLTRRVKRTATVDAIPTVQWSQPEIAPADDGQEGAGGKLTRPSARTGHSATRLRDAIIVFGGASERGLLSDTWVLRAPRLSPPSAEAQGDHDAGDANTDAGITSLTWMVPEVSGAHPSARAYHTCAGRIGWADEDEQLILFGGSSSSGRLNDLHVLHVPSFIWTEPKVDGAPPAPRCWHAAASISP